MKFLVFLFAVSLTWAACDINDFECDNDIHFPDGTNSFYVTGSVPAQDQQNVVLDSKITLQFSGIVPRSASKSGFFYLLNQRTGKRTEILSSCISQPGDFTLIVDVTQCLETVLDENTDYMFYISQKLEAGELVTFSNQRGTPISALAFMNTRSSLHFRTVSSIPADVVPAKCSPSFGSTDVPIRPAIIIAFSSIIHLGSGKITLSSTNHPLTSEVIDVLDTTHVSLTDDALALLVFGVRLNGNDHYQVTFPAGLVRSASGSYCGTTDDFKFSTAMDDEVPFITNISPNNYQANLPSNTRIRITFSEPVTGAGGFISFRSSHSPSEVRVSSSSASEVVCVKELCSIYPSLGFSEGTYEMSFSKSVFKDTSNNELREGVTAHVFTIGKNSCGLGYLQVEDNEDCKCASVGDQCQCVCGQTTFVKDL